MPSCGLNAFCPRHLCGLGPQPFWNPTTSPAMGSPPLGQLCPQLLQPGLTDTALTHDLAEAMGAEVFEDKGENFVELRG